MRARSAPLAFALCVLVSAALAPGCAGQTDPQPTAPTATTSAPRTCDPATQACVRSFWTPAVDGAVITSISAPEDFSPPLLAVEWEAPERQGIDALVRRGDALVSVGGLELAVLSDEGTTTCRWTFILPGDPEGRENRIIAVGQCESWIPSPPGEPTFAPLELEQTRIYGWDGAELTEELSPRSPGA